MDFVSIHGMRNPTPLFTHWWKRPKPIGWIHIHISFSSWRNSPAWAVIPVKMTWIFFCRGSLPPRPPGPLPYLLNPLKIS